MQTFLPYPDFAESAKVLDRQRLGKQRVEAYQILQAITNPSYGWQNHPAVNMWRGHHWGLFDYAVIIIAEWTYRGYKDSIYMKLMKMKHQINPCNILIEDLPSWLGNEQFHASHRSNLLRKFPEHYRKFWPTEPDNLPYIWPTKDLK